MPNNFIEKINSLDELREKDLYIIYEDSEFVRNDLKEIAEKRGISNADLAKITGVSRQSITDLMKNRMEPRIGFALKLGYRLGIPIEDIFKLTENAWIEPYRGKQGNPLFIDMYNLEIIDNKEKKSRIKKNGFEYYNPETLELITKDAREELIKNHVYSNLESKLQEVEEEYFDENLNANEIESIVIEKLKNEIRSKYLRIYNKLGKKIDNYILR